ncbi:MAG: tetratricopeptide repeat protein [Pseudomonadota bacterium]
MAQPAQSLTSDLQMARQHLTEGKLTDAERILTRLKAVTAPHPLLHEYLGFIAVQRQDHKKAIRHYRKAIKLSPSSADLKTKLAEVLLATGDDTEASALAQSVRRADPQDVKALMILGMTAGKTGRLDEAVGALSDAADIDPNQFPVWYQLGRLYLKMGQAREARDALVKADTLHPDHWQTLELLGRAATTLGETSAAIEWLERARALVPSENAFCETTLHLAEACWRAQQLDKALAALTDIENREPGHPRAWSLRATILHEQGHHERALQDIRALATNVEALSADWFPHYVEPQCLLALGRHDEAASAFTLANQRKSIIYKRQGTDKTLFEQYARDALSVYAQYAAQDGDDRDHSGAGEGRAFINGFPRSGTTLIDSILRMHSSIAVAEEADAADQCWQEAERLIPGGRNKLVDMTADAADHLRQYYTNALQPALSTDEPGRFVIDRHATGLVQAGLMKHLFPRAQFFLMMRHPCDAVLSAWFRNFGPNHHTANYLTIEDAARMYDLMMTLHTTLEERHGLNAKIVKYEDLVTDLRGTVEMVLHAMGLPWEDQLQRFYQSSHRPKGTASFNQIAKPIYQTAANRFTHYQSTLDPVMPILTPWIERFGYA